MGQRRSARGVLRLAAFIAACVLGGTTVLMGGARPAAAADTAGQLMLVMDSSGSMAGPDGSGGTKIGAAKKAVTRLVGSAPAGAEIGLRVYGANKDKNDPAACRDSRRVADVGPVDKRKITSAANAMTPRGQTPIAYSLRKAAGDFTGSAPRTIMLVSDGIETCDPDPCKVVARLRDAGVRLRIDVIGFRVDGKARDQLQCIARSGHGTYYDAEDGPSLQNTVTRNSVRALRQYRFAGTPVSGSADPRSGPVVRPGQYTDTLPATTSVRNPVTRFYTIDRKPGETVHVSATVLPPKADRDRRAAVIGTGFVTGALEDCGTNSGDRVDDTGDTGPLTASSSLDLSNVRDSCNAGGRFRVAVRWAMDGSRAGTGGVPVELTVLTEPKVTNEDALPRQEGLTSDAVKPSPHAAAKVAGAGSFTDAPTITPGTYADTIRPGETLFYRVKLGWGQLLAYRADFPTLSGPDARTMAAAHPRVDILSASPLRTKAAATSVKHSSSFYDGTQRYAGAATTLWFATPKVRYKNRSVGNGDQTTSGSLAGYYYIEVHMAAFGGDRVEVPFRLTADVQGKVGGVPRYQASAAGDPVSQQDRGTTPGQGGDPRPAASPTGAAGRTGFSPIGWVALGGGAILVLAGAGTVAALALRRR